MPCVRVCVFYRIYVTKSIGDSIAIKQRGGLFHFSFVISVKNIRSTPARVHALPDIAFAFAI